LGVATFFFAATFLADEGFFAGFVDFFRDVLGAPLFGADFACVGLFDFLFLEPAMVAISAPGSLASCRDPQRLAG
jgi:hypothetical protein